MGTEVVENAKHIEKGRAVWLSDAGSSMHTLPRAGTGTSPLGCYYRMSGGYGLSPGCPTRLGRWTWGGTWR